jgi:ABC-type Mn2+/Zn2+ transport system ATPase subunit
MITRIEAYRYRCFEKLDLQLDRFQVFVGPNGAGKTTLLDIPIVLGEMLATRSIEKAFFESTPTHPRPRADYAGDLIHKRLVENFVLAVEAKLPPELVSELEKKRTLRLGKRAVKSQDEHLERWFTRIRYEIQFELFNDTLQIGQEYLMLLTNAAGADRPATGALLGEWRSPGAKQIFPVIQRPRGGKVSFCPELEKRGPRNEYGFPVTEPAFANVFADRSRYGASLWLRDLLTTGACAYQPSLSALRNPHRRIRQPSVVRDAATLAWLAHDLYHPTQAELTADPKRKPPGRAFEKWQRFSRLALQGLDRIEAVVREDDKHAYLRLHYRNGAKVPSSGLSDGTLSILATTILPYLTHTPELMTYEEPENGVHPRGIELLVEALQTIHGSQVLVSSHSPLVLAKCMPNQVVCLTLDEGGSATAIRGDQHPALTEWKKSMDLGTLLAAGILG